MLDSSAPRMLPGRRWIARLLDWVLVLFLTSPLWYLTVESLESRLIRGATALGGQTLPELLAMQWSSLGGEFQSGLAQLWGTVVLAAMVTLAVQLVAVALYDLALHATWSRTVGKALLGIKVVPVPSGLAGSCRKRLSLASAISRTALTVLLPGAAWLLLTYAVISLNLLPALLGVVLLAASMIECVVLRRQPYGQTSWHDRRCLSVVVGVNWEDQLRHAGELQRRAAANTQHYAQQAWQAPVTQQAASQTKNAVEQTKAAAQQAWQADPTRRAREQTRYAAERLYNAPTTQQVTERGKELFGRARNSRWGSARAKGDREMPGGGSDPNSLPDSLRSAPSESTEPDQNPPS